MYCSLFTKVGDSELGNAGPEIRKSGKGTELGNAGTEVGNAEVGEVEVGNAEVRKYRGPENEWTELGNAEIGSRKRKRLLFRGILFLMFFF
jgi:hypothetical protein